MSIWSIFPIIRLVMFFVIVAALIGFGILLIWAAKKRREKRDEAVHQLFDNIRDELNNDDNNNLN